MPLVAPGSVSTIKSSPNSTDVRVLIGPCRAPPSRMRFRTAVSVPLMTVERTPIGILIHPATVSRSRYHSVQAHLTSGVVFPLRRSAGPTR